MLRRTFCEAKIKDKQKIDGTGYVRIAMEMKTFQMDGNYS